LRAADQALKAAHHDPMEMIMKPAGTLNTPTPEDERTRFRPTGT